MTIEEQLDGRLQGVINNPIWSTVVPYCNGVENHPAIDFVFDDIMDVCGNECRVTFISPNLSAEKFVNMMIKYALEKYGLDTTGNYTERYQTEISKCRAKINRIPLYIDNTPYQSIDEVIAAIRQWYKEKDVNTFYIDFYHRDEPEKLIAQIDALEALEEELIAQIDSDDELGMSINFLAERINDETI